MGILIRTVRLIPKGMKGCDMLFCAGPVITCGSVPQFALGSSQV